MTFVAESSLLTTCGCQVPWACQVRERRCVWKRKCESLTGVVRTNGAPSSGPGVSNVISGPSVKMNGQSTLS